MQTYDTYDYIVVGGGSSGCVVAARLAESGNYSVLLLEAGNAAEKNPETMSADGFIQAFSNDNCMRDRLSEPQANCVNRRLYLGSGWGMGGSGAVNGMVYTRGDKLDFEQWPEGWQWKDVSPYFDQLEKRLKINTRTATQFTATCVDASTQAGFKQKDGLNDGELCGYIGYQMMNYEGDRRRSSYMAFVHQSKNSKLTVKTDALVHRIVFDEERRATAVEYEQNGVKTISFVAQEVIMCAGALETPKLLMLSGVGPKSHLQSLGIPVVLDSPAVGKNLQDHPNVCIFYRGKNELDCFYPQLYGFDQVNNSLGLPRNQADTCYVFYSAPASIKQSMKRMLPALVLPPGLFQSKKIRKLINSLVEFMFYVPFTKLFVSKVYGIVVILGKPKSRGEIKLASLNPRDQAAIDPAYFKDPQDLKTMLDGVARAQSIAKQSKFSEWGNLGLSVGAKTQDKEKLKKWIYGSVMTTFHFCGSCMMGEKENAPVDLQLRLKGIKNIRVADASVIPEIPVSALNSPSMMIAYRAADLVLQGNVNEKAEYIQESVAAKAVL